MFRRLVWAVTLLLISSNVAMAIEVRNRTSSALTSSRTALSTASVKTASASLDVAKAAS